MAASGPSRPGLRATLRLVDQDRSDLLAALPRLDAAVTQARDELAQAVKDARAAGCTWREIGEVLGGVSRQAAWERFNRRGYKTE